MTAPLLLDLTHTSHSLARTGIQRVTRAIARTLGADALPVCYDPYAGVWRELEPWEEANLTETTSSASQRGAHWPFAAKLRGRLRRWTSRGPSVGFFPSTLARAARGLLMPEIFSPAVAGTLPGLLARVSGPRVALFHDAIALKYPEITPAKTVARFPSYLRELLQFDGIAAVSDDSCRSLLDYWQWLDLPVALPPVVAIPLGIDPVAVPNRPPGHSRDALPVVLCVGSLEGRKNHLALLEACASLWTAGGKFELRLIGLAHPQTGRAALARVQALQRAGRPLRYDGPVDDATLESAYAECAFTVYPSLIEGFGLPILESLARGKPCICSARGALGESSRGGGCVALEQMNAPRLAGAIHALLSSPAAYQELCVATKARTFKTWSTYVSELNTWMSSLPPRARSPSQSIVDH